MFSTRWRWNAIRALAVLRRRGGRRIAAAIQRMQADDLLAAVFPQHTACQEQGAPYFELPDHPLVRQTVTDCLHEAMDADGLVRVLERIECGRIRLHARDTTEPSPMAHGILNAMPYAFLDDAPLEERRARAVSVRRTLPEHARDLGDLDAEAIERVRREAWPEPRDADEAHDALLSVVAVRCEWVEGWGKWLQELAGAGRATRLTVTGGALWCAAEQLHLVERVYPDGSATPPLQVPPESRAHTHGSPDRERALQLIARGHLEHCGPISADLLAQRLLVPTMDALRVLCSLEVDGLVLRGRFSPGVKEQEFCDRRLLARIHRATLDRLRRDIEPVSAQAFLRFLLSWHHLTPSRRRTGKQGLLEAIGQLQGFEIAAQAWERDILPGRLSRFQAHWLDELCLSGQVVWGRLGAASNGAAEVTASPLVSGPHVFGPNTSGQPASRQQNMTRITPITLARRQDFPWLARAMRAADDASTGQARDPINAALRETSLAFDVFHLLRRRGALFQRDIEVQFPGPPLRVEEALWVLVSQGLVTADGFQALRSLVDPRVKRARRAAPRPGNSRRRRCATMPSWAEGRWSLLPEFAGDGDRAASSEPWAVDEALAEAVANQLLARYGVVFRSLLARERFRVPWRQVVRALRRQEARGVLRGGRFVSGFPGEQYALPEAVDALRRLRKQEPAGDEIVLNAADPLNLVGILTPGPRVPSVPSNLIAFRDGMVLGSLEGGRIVPLAEDAEELLKALFKRTRSRARTLSV